MRRLNGVPKPRNGMKEAVEDTIQKATDTYGITIILALLLVLWYEFQIVVYTQYGLNLFQWLFTFSSVTRPTLGWILSTLSHGSLNHLTFNVAMLLVFGGFAERHLRRWEYLVFFFGIGTAASFANLLLWPEDAPSIGASAAVYGLVSYSLYHYVRNHDRELYPYATPDGYFGPERILLKTVLVTLGFSLIVLQLLLKLGGYLPSGRSAVGAHAFGFLFGVLYEYWQPALGGSVCES